MVDRPDIDSILKNIPGYTKDMLKERIYWLATYIHSLENEKSGSEAGGLVNFVENNLEDNRAFFHIVLVLIEQNKEVLKINDMLTRCIVDMYMKQMHHVSEGEDK